MLVIIGVIDLAANFPYIRDALKGKTKPNIASWSTWTLINGISAVAALAAGGAFNTVVLGTSYFIGSLSILLIGVYRGTRKYTVFDGVCQSIAIIGVILWQVSNDPNFAILFAIIADIFAVIPTVKHAYFHPNEETWSTFAIASVGAFAFLCLAPSISFAALAIPIDFFLVNTLLAAIILYRDKKLGYK